MSRVIYFNLIEYKNVLQLLRKFDEKLRSKNINDCLIFLEDIKHLMLDNSKQIHLNEDYLNGYKIFPVNKFNYDKELECEILRPLSQRNIVCFKKCLQELEFSNYLSAIGEFIDCVLDYNKSDKKIYISLNEYYLFETLIEIIQNKLKKEQ